MGTLPRGEAPHRSPRDLTVGEGTHRSRLVQGGEGKLTSTGAQVHTGRLAPSSQEPAVLKPSLE